MRKKIAIVAVVSALMGLAGSVEAGNSRGGHKGGHHYAPPPHYGKHYKGHYGRKHYKHGRHYSHYRPKHHNHHAFRDGLKFAAGALIFGSVVHAVNRHATQVVYRPAPNEPYRDHWYRIASDGQCVEVRLNQYGEEVWTPAEPYRCR